MDKNKDLQNSKVSDNNKLRIPKKYKQDYTYLKAKFLQLIEDEAEKSNLQVTQKIKFKTMCIEYLNLILKVQRDRTEYVDSDESQDEIEESSESQEDQLFQQKQKLLQKALKKKIQQSQKTVPNQISIDIDVSKPENMFILKNGVEVPIESQLDFSKLQQFPKAIKDIHQLQHHYCNCYRELLSHQQWLNDKNK